MQFFLTTFAISFGLLAVQSRDQTSVKADTGSGTEDGKIQVNIRNLFDSLTKNDVRNAGAYRNLLEGEAVKERQAFDAAKEEFRFARENAHKQARDLNKNGKVFETATIIKREAKSNESEYEYNFTTPKKRYTVTTTLSPAEFEKSVDKLGVTGEAKKKMIDLHNQVNELNLKEYVRSCANDFQHILSYLERTYMSREYVSSHWFVREAREKLIDEKLAQILLPENDRRLARLQHMYNRSVGSKKRLNGFRIMLNNTISPLYHSRKQHQFELFLTWLLEPSMNWTTDHKATEDLFALHHELQTAVNNGMQIKDFIKCVLAHDEKYTNITKKFSTDDFAAAYDEIARSETVYAKLMHMELTWDERKKQQVTDAVYGGDKVKYCSALLRKVYIYIQPSVPQLPEVVDGHIGENEFVDLPDEIYQWEKSPHQL